MITIIGQWWINNITLNPVVVGWAALIFGVIYTIRFALWIYTAGKNSGQR